MQNYVFGADIGGTSVKLGLFYADGKLLEKWEIPTRTANGGVHVLPDVAQAIAESMGRNGISASQIVGIGIGVPGPVDDSFTVNKCVNLGWGVFNIKGRMNELLPDIPNIAAGNDANVAALGELWRRPRQPECGHDHPGHRGWRRCGVGRQNRRRQKRGCR